MAMDPVPWFVGGGAQHSPEVARLLAYAATGGAEGIVSVGDLQVLPLSVPGQGVQVLPGAALIRQRGSDDTGQTYVARNASATTVSVTPTGSSGGRSDLVVVQVEDPTVAGEPWQDPADPKVGPYVFIRVIPNVPAGTTRLQDVSGYSTRSAVTLARIDYPASTGTVTAAMIKDLRKVARPRQLTGKNMSFPTGSNPMPTGSYSGWPTGIGEQVDVPDWATKALVTANIGGIYAPVNSGVTAAGLRTYVGPGTQPANAQVGVELGQNGVIVDEGGSTPRRIHATVAGIHDVRKYAGERVWIMTQAVRSSGNAALSADYQVTAVIEWTFLEE